MKQKIARAIFILILALASAAILIAAVRPRKRNIEPVSDERLLGAYMLLLADLPDQSDDYPEYIRNHPPSPDQIPQTLELLGEPRILKPGSDGVSFTVDIRESGHFALSIRHRRSDLGLGNVSIGVQIDGDAPFSEAQSLELRRSWSDETKSFGRDRYNDEMLPHQIPDRDWVEAPLFDPSGRTVRPLYFFLAAGARTIRIVNGSSLELEIDSVRLESPEIVRAYEAYWSQFHDRQVVTAGGVEPLELDAISYSAKNSYDIRLGSLSNPTASPSHAVDHLLNIVDGESWDEAGEEIRYRFSVPQSAFYTLSFHYNNPKSDFSAFRTIRIDGAIPFDEVAPYEFPANGGSRWAIETLSSGKGEPFALYLEAGEHTLSLTAEKEPVAEAIRMLKTVTAHMNYFGIEIMKVAGKDIDKERTWRLTDYIEKTPAYLDAYKALVADIIDKLAVYSTKGDGSSMTASLHTALFKLEKLAEKPDELPIYLQDIYSTSIYDRPITQILGDTVNLLEDCRLNLDDFTLALQPVEGRANAGWLRRGLSSVRSLLATFTSDKYVTRIDDKELNVWVTRPITHIDLMQKMADAAYPEGGDTRVKISTMPEPNRLILATAAKTTPDVAMGIPSFIPFDLAVRGACLALTDFEDFWSFAGQFSPGAFIPYVLNEEVYAMPETLDFHSLVYRRDIFKQLNLRPPDTWQDVIDLLPVLQRYGMNFYHPIAGGLPTLKWFYQTSPFVYQFGGRLYDPDGLAVSLGDPKTVAGLRFLSELFNLYALQEQVPAFYNSFRFGVIPVGIVDSQSYLQLKYAAPELKGQWSLAPYPGIPDEEGNPQRWFIANGVAAVIMKDTKRPEQSWDYLKWWLSEETQIDFGYRLQSTYGPEFLWISGNLRALAQAPIEAEELEVILEQVKWQRDVPRTPAQYMLERGLSDIWINSATRSRPIRTEIDKMIPVIDRELKRKMIEFGFIDVDGKILKPFTVPDIAWIKEKMFGHTEAGNNE